VIAIFQQHLHRQLNPGAAQQEAAKRPFVLHKFILIPVQRLRR
jgi:hypothetical protein